MTTLSDQDITDAIGFDINEPSAPPDVIYRKLDDARATGASFIFQVDRSTFRAYPTAHVAVVSLARLVEEEREVFENIDGAKPLRGFIDCDAKPTASDADLDKVADAFRVVAISMGVPDDKARPLVLLNDRPDKRSRHYLADRWGFANWQGLKRFEDAVRALVGAAGLPNGLTTIDTMAKRRFALRIPGVPKMGIPNSILQPTTSNWQKDARYNARQTVDTWLIQGAEPLTIYAKPWDEPEAEAPTVDIANPAANEINRPEGVIAVDPNQRRQEFVTSALRCFPFYVLRGNAVAGESIIFDRVRPHYCPVCVRDHESEGAYVCEEVVGGELRACWLRCQRADKHAAALHSTRWVRDADYTGVLRPLDNYDGLGYESGASRTIQRINSRYNSDGIAAGSTRDTAVRSVWGTGKTVYDVREVRDTIDRARATKHDSFIVHITMRLSLTGSTIGGFAVHNVKYRPTDYRKISGNLDPKNNPKHRHVVFQAESLKRIPKECPSPTLIIVDEPEALFQHMYGNDGPLSADKAASVSSLRNLIERADRVILLDNDLTEAHVAAFEALRARRPGYTGFDVIINEAKPWAGMDFKVTKGDDAPENVRLAALSFIHREKLKREAGEPWNGCVIACHSLDEARALFRMARTVLGENPDDAPEESSGSLYTSETSGVVKARDFADAGNSWSKKTFVIYTGTVSVGVSNDHPHISHAFGIFGSDNATAENSAQMLFRSRQLRSVLVGYRGMHEFGLPHTPAELLQWLVKPFNRHIIPDGIRDDRNPLAGMLGETSSDPEALRRAVDNFEGRVFITATLSKLRSRADWLGRFIRTIENAGITPQLIEDRDKLNLVREIAAKYGKHYNEEGTKVNPFGLAKGIAWNSRAALISANAEAAASAYRERVAKGTQDQPRITTEGEHAGDEGARLATMLRVPVGELTPEWVSHYGKNRGAIATRFDRLNRLANCPETLDAEKAGRKRLDCPTISSEREGCAHAVEALRALGLELGSAEGITVTPATLAAAEPTARTVAAVAQRLYGYKNTGRTKERAGDAMKPRTVLTLINVAADYIGADLKPVYATQAAKKNGKPTSYALRWAWTRPETMEGGPEVVHPVTIPQIAPVAFTVDDIYA
jgi:hypothetical protein